MKKWVYRSLLLAAGLLLVFGAIFAAVEVNGMPKVTESGTKMHFPYLLPGTDLYIWSISANQEGTFLLVQNIGCTRISEVELTVSSADKLCVFCAHDLLPGEKRMLIAMSVPINTQTKTYRLISSHIG